MDRQQSRITHQDQPNMGNLAIPAPPPPASSPEALAAPDPHRQQMAARYARVQSIVVLIMQAAVVLLFLTVFNPLNPTWSAALRDWARTITSDPGGVSALYALALGGLWIGVMLPVMFVSGYALPRRYGLVTQRFGGWLLDLARGTLYTLAVWVAAVVVFYALVRAAPGWWWLLAAALLWLAYVAAEYLTPVVIWPLFSKMRPLDDPELSRRLKALAERAGTPVLGVYVLDWSSRATHANAWLAGLGRTRRIVLADTLLHNFTYDELESIIAHELAHHVHNDIPKQLAVRAGLVFVSMLLAYGALALFAGAPPLEGPADVAALPIVLLAFLAQSFFTGTVGNYMSRRSERSADVYSMRLTGNADAFRSSMIKMGDLNLIEANPAAWSVAAGYTHPVTAERVALADSMAGRPPSDAAVGAGNQQGRWVARIALTWGVPVVLGIGIAAWSVGSGLDSFGGVSTLGAERGPSGSWDEHLAIVRARAAEIAPDAVLYSVTARPYDASQDWLRTDVVLDVRFNFVSSKGLFTIATLDKRPPEVYYVGDIVPAADYLQSGVPLPDPGRAAARAEYLRIKPRLAFAASLPDGLRFAQLDKAALYPYMELDLDTGTAKPEWLVIYSGTAQQLEVRMDAVTGEVLSRRVETPTYEESDNY